MSAPVPPPEPSREPVYVTYGEFPWPRWVKRLFAAAPEIPNPPPPPPPELSCFVKGLIRSIMETPGEWERELQWQDTWRHTSGVRIWGDYGLSHKMTEMRVSVAPSLSTHERRLIRRVVEDFLIEPARRKVAEQAHQEALKEDAKYATLRAPFEKLGCPDTTP